MIKYKKGGGLWPALAAMEPSENWITAAEALQLLAPIFGGQYSARLAICKRAHNGLVRARASRFVYADKAADNVEVPVQF